jgi:RNA polymerase sigma factor (TIGR02999 family)
MKNFRRGMAGYNPLKATLTRGSECSETTQLLRAWASGDLDALEQLTPRVYDELRRIAGHFMKDERPGRTIQTTALVHEAYLKLIDVTHVDWQHRAHFFAVAAWRHE